MSIICDEWRSADPETALCILSLLRKQAMGMASFLRLIKPGRCREQGLAQPKSSSRVHAEHNGYRFDKFERHDHFLCRDFVFFEMRGFEMRLVGICVTVDFKDSDVGHR
jgi:hypothetical protein